MAHEQHLSRSIEHPLTPEIPIRHKCGLAAYYFFDEQNAGGLEQLIGPMTRVNHRGQEGIGAAGIGFDGESDSFKTSGMVKDNLPVFLEHTKPMKMALGHCRYSTSGNLDSWQPFVDEDLDNLQFDVPEGAHSIQLIHNGNITNPYTLLEHIPPEFHHHLSSDTHALYLALKYATGKTFADRLEMVLPKLEGAFSLIITDPETQELYLIRDSQGFRPLHYGPLKDGSGYLAASETYAFGGQVDEDQISAVEQGQCLRINNSGVEKVDIKMKLKPLRQCLFELIYIGFPVSEIFNVHVAEFRIRCGRRLAEMDIAEGFMPDVIVGVKESGSLAAKGYLSKMIEHLLQQSWDNPEQREEIRQKIQDLSTSEALYRTRMDRTFIKPSGRKKAVAEKFVIDRKYVQGKTIVYIDDSVVFGTTMDGLKTKSEDAEAFEIHLRSASPPIIDQCDYGVDHRGGSLIAQNRNNEQIAKKMGIKSIRYPSLDDARQIAYELGAIVDSFCHACFSGEHPVNRDPDLMIHKSEEVSRF